LFKKNVAASLGQAGDVVDELFDLLASCIAERLNVTELGGEALHLGRVEIVLANEQAETITKQRLSIAREIHIVSRVLLGIRGEAVPGINRSRGTPDFFDRAEANAVGLAECAVDGSGLGDSHFGAANDYGYVRRICIAEAHESFGLCSFENGRCEDPASARRIAKFLEGFNLNAGAALSPGDS